MLIYEADYDSTDQVYLHCPSVPSKSAFSPDSLLTFVAHALFDAFEAQLGALPRSQRAKKSSVLEVKAGTLLLQVFL